MFIIKKSDAEMMKRGCEDFAYGEEEEERTIWNYSQALPLGDCLCFMFHL